LGCFQGELGDSPGMQQLSRLGVQPEWAEAEACLDRHRRDPQCPSLKLQVQINRWENTIDT